MKKLNSPQSFILILLFLGLIISPLLIQLTGFKIKAENFENRIMAQMPKMSNINPENEIEFYKDCSVFINDFTKYVDDNFPFRNIFYNLFRDIKMKLFHISPFPDDVILGENGWFFLGDKYSDIIKESIGLKVFSEPELKKGAENICEYDSSLNKEGIKFYFTVAPNKVSVYGRFLPIVKSLQPTKLEQLKSELAKRNIRVIDLKEDFNSMPHIRLYHKTNSHWNDVGAFLGYLTIMKRIQKDFPYVSIMNIHDFTIDTTFSFQEDLTKMLHMRVKEALINLTPVHPGNAIEVENKMTVWKVFGKDVNVNTKRFKCEGKPLKVLVFCDSFFAFITPFLTESFGETVIIDTWMNEEVIRIEKPDIVINETVERDLDYFVIIQ